MRIQTTRTLLLLVVISVLGLFTTARAADDFSYPDTSAGRAAEAFITAINSGDAEVMARFHANHRSPEQLAQRSADERARQTLQRLGMLGKLTPIAILEETTHQIAIQAASDKLTMQLRCTFFFDETPPHYLTSIELRPYSPPKGDDANWYKRDWETLEALLTNAVDGSGVPAIAAIVMVDGQVVDEAAVGIRSIATDEPVTLLDRFHLGSITKSMTATLITRLIEQDKLRWDSTLGELFSGTEIREEYRIATVEQLLQHRAGFPHGTSDDDEIYQSTDDASASIVARALKSEPIGRIGDDFNYSNIGYAVAGHIAERLTGQSWEQLIRNEIFTPFEMTSGDFGWPYTAATPHQPRGHSTSGDTFVTAPDDYTIGPEIAPAGDVQCTVRDLARYAWIHTQGFNGIDGPLSASTFKRLHTPLMESSSKNGYACGWSISETEGIGTVHMHNGSGGTYYAHMEIHPEQNFVIVVATNVGLEGQDIAQRIVDAVTSRYAH